MASHAQLDHLRQWLKDHGGFLHPNVDIAFSEECGVHVRAIADVGPQTCFCAVPHSLALSSLNAYVDDDFPVFKQSRRRLTPEAIGYFYLMHQYITRHRSFWGPYLESLPGPDDEHCTPFWFGEQDLAWLADTDVLHSTDARKANHEAQYRNGLDVLSRAGIDVSLYSWDLFRWAVTMFTSRSFSSRAIHPQDSKYWTAYKGGSRGRRQTVLLDLSHSPAEELDFPVLFPIADAANHKPDARAEWSFDPGRFSITTKDAVTHGAEIFNNYGPKGNAELLLGYGFCIAENPFDGVLLTLKPPSDALKSHLREVHPGYFDSEGQWYGERATFALGRISFEDRSPIEVFESIPEPLLELMLYILREERELRFEFVAEPLEYLRSESGDGRRYLPHVARMVVQSLAPKLSKLQSSTPQDEPANKRQEQAKVYRTGQVAIMESVIGALRCFTRSLLPTYPFIEKPGPLLATLELLLQLINDRGHEALVEDFLRGIAASAGTSDVDQLRQAGWEDDVLVLLLCFLRLVSQGSNDSDRWVSDMLPEYLAWSNTGSPESRVEGAELEQAQGLLQIVYNAREACSDNSGWHDNRWTTSFIVHFGGQFIKHDSFLMMVPVVTAGGQHHEEVRPVVYIHG